MHTKGPWIHQRCTDSDSVFDHEVMGAYENGHRKLVGEFQNEPDAIMAACAPELVEVLQRVADSLEAEIQHRASGELPRRIRRDMEDVWAARDLIAKALGK
jgi:hypothetical protein